jgi:septal ring factor EnvC (AmiA/AmiB activator)
MKRSILICILFFAAIVVAQAQTTRSKASKSRTVHTKAKPQVRTQTKARRTVASRKKSLHSGSRRSVSARSKKRTRKTSTVKRVVTPKLASFTIKKVYSPEEQMLATGFAQNRGKLLWPVNGTVTIPFGNYTIQETTIRGNNPGITISTPDKDVPVKAVFDGVVSDIDSRGELTTIYIRHGKYYTVYSNVAAIHVAKGAVVKTGDIIGSVGEAYTAEGGELTFLLMVEENNVNPVQWLSTN